MSIEKNYDKNQIKLSQTGFINRLFSKYGMLKCNSVQNPEEVVAIDQESLKKNVEYPFKQVVGSLIYLALSTRLDISHAIALAAQTDVPTNWHIDKLKRILRYLAGTIDICKIGRLLK